MKKIVLILSFFLIGLQSFAIEDGKTAPYFRVFDSGDKELNSDILKGKIIAGFYESRETSEKNNELKDELSRYKIESKKETEGKVERLAVVDGTPANFASRWIWKKVMNKKSIEKKITIYCDWDGSMKKAFGFKEDESNFIIIDKKGVVRYIRSGKIPFEEFEKIKQLLKKIT